LFAVFLVASAFGLAPDPLRVRYHKAFFENRFHVRDQEALSFFRDLSVQSDLFGLLSMSVETIDGSSIDDFDFDFVLDEGQMGAVTRNMLTIKGAGKSEGGEFSFEAPIDAASILFQVEKLAESHKLELLKQHHQVVFKSKEIKLGVLRLTSGKLSPELSNALTVFLTEEMTAVMDKIVELSTPESLVYET